MSLYLFAKKTTPILLLALILIFSAAILPESNLKAQNRDYIMASRLMQQQKYDEAWDLFESLLENNPGNQLFFQQAQTALLAMKEYDTSLELFKKYNGLVQRNVQLQILHAEALHLSGKKEQAFEKWDTILSRNKTQFQIYQLIANSLTERMEHDKAAEVYLKAQKQFNNPLLFIFELANAYMRAGEYEKAVRQFITQLNNEPERMRLVQRQFQRFNDDYLLDVAILELEEIIRNHTGSESIVVVKARKELLLWLLQERNLFKRALAFAREIESGFDNSYFQYEISANLIRNKQYELAIDALQYYVDDPGHPRHTAALLRLANTKLEYVDELQRDHIDINNKQKDLKTEARGHLNQIITRFPDSDQYSDALGAYIEFLLIRDHTTENIPQLLKEFTTKTGNNEQDFVSWTEGLFALHEENFDMARVYFTRVKNDEESERQEESYLYLALTDFFDHDFEFANIQLKALERRHTSYYANEALELHNIIRKGTEKDSVTAALEHFADARLALYQGETAEIPHHFKNAELTTQNKLYPDFSLLLFETYKLDQPLTAYLWISELSDIAAQSNAHERILWERAQLAHQLSNESNFNQFLTNYLTTRELSTEEQKTLNALLKSSDVQSIIENVVLTYPNGFYAPHARRLLRAFDASNAAS